MYEGQNVTSRQKCVVKILKPTRMIKIRREIMILRYLQGGPNVINLLDVVKDPQTRTPSFVFEFVDNVDDEEFYPTLPDMDIRLYVFELLRVCIIFILPCIAFVVLIMRCSL